MLMMNSHSSIEHCNLLYRYKPDLADDERQKRNRSLRSLKKTRRSTQPRRVEEVSMDEDQYLRRSRDSSIGNNYRRSASRRSVFRRSTPRRPMRRNSRAFLP